MSEPITFSEYAPLAVVVGAFICLFGVANPRVGFGLLFILNAAMMLCFQPPL